ncbi:hypothetical protein E5720_18980 [Rhodococcus sp. PAMC28707]|uniref:hypothetical protein n=1 Tax=unclassified Rhodococcus (in: high G+C Gram-positive bacteria) TaxID=192944 RepID=UPI00109DBD9B|nr:MULTISPECIES: hypothetical protein [unclassified Rhodococcus (in: high G+C Gram-positive bacteria)]QCB51582.1 hypothetical protein E5769_16545 [Rhodococcus sp. PAMC28705]QCB60250.1 hypothetical protein E5720_18980 [Rhodococcus sp. PAMC28707]
MNTAAERSEAMRRYATLEPHLTDGVPLARAVRDTQIHERAARRWLTRLPRWRSRPQRQETCRPISYSSVARSLMRWDPAALILAREGASALRDKYGLVYRRQSETSNQIWQVAHTELDIEAVGYIVGLGAPRPYRRPSHYDKRSGRKQTPPADVRNPRHPLRRPRQRLQQ